MSSPSAKSDGSSGEMSCNKLTLELRKYLLLLAILAATVTYVAGLNPPGGVWMDIAQGGHLTGNQILVVTYHTRYNAFSYSNATAFMASAVVILLLVFCFKDKGKGKDSSNKVTSTKLLVVLWLVMLLDLLALVVAYVAGASRDTFTTVMASLLVSLIFILWGLNKLFRFLVCPGDQHRHTGGGTAAPAQCPQCNQRVLASSDSEKEDKEEKRRRRIMLLLAIFATTITYTVGQNPPGGFWLLPEQEQGDGGHRAGDPVLQQHHWRRFAVFFVCNTISFVASLAVIMLLLTNQFKRKVPYALVWVSLAGLVGAYAAGSCREKASTAGVIVLYLVGPIVAVLCLFVVMQPLVVKYTSSCLNREGDKVVKKKVEGGRGLLNTAPSLVLLLATLAATVTYQAGMNPPGGFWPDDRDGHKGGDPILLSKHAMRYRVFYYCNSMSLAASLVVIFMVLRYYLSTSTRGVKNNGSGSDNGHKPVTTTTPEDGTMHDEEHKPATTTPPEDGTGAKSGSIEKERLGVHVVILEVVMILDLISLIGAFAAGCGRDVSTSIYVVTLAGGALVYVVFHIIFFTLHRHVLHKGSDDMAEKRKLLLLLAILVVTLTYQAGLTPPGGFWLRDDVGHHAGDPVLLSNYPGRYTAFFYLNATGFMASVALTILLVNPNLYMAGIKCYALQVCMVAGLFGLMGAYASGSSRHLRTSICMIVLIDLVFIFVTVILLVFWIKPECIEELGREDNKLVVVAICGCGSKPAVPMPASKDDSEVSPGIIEAGHNSADPAGEGTAKKEASSSLSSTEEESGGMVELHKQRKYLMLLGILAASVTYQAGLVPPGGFWPDNNDGHAVGNSILRDSSHRRYDMFFYCNSASFVASMVVITLQLLVDLGSQETAGKNFIEAKFLVLTAQCMMGLDLVCLMLAYAAGSTREWENSGYIVLFLVAIYVTIELIVTISKKYCGVASSKAAPDDQNNHNRAVGADAA